jgi:hypothetical protein
MKNLMDKTDDVRLKKLFSNIETEHPANDFTSLVMQKIVTEKITVAQKQKQGHWLWKWMFYGLLFPVLFAVVLIYMPEISGWLQSISVDIPQNYLVNLKNLGKTMLSSLQYIYLSPVFLVIIGSSSILISIVGLSGLGITMKKPTL